MKKQLSAFGLGATLYIPATRLDIVETIATAEGLHAHAQSVKVRRAL